MIQVAWEHTEEGAAAFAEYYLSLINYTGLHPSVGILEQFSSPDCKTCAAYERNLDYLIENNATHDIAPLELKASRAIELTNRFEAFVELNVLSYSSITGDGQKVDQFDGGTGLTLIFTLTPGDPWVIQEMQGRH